MQILKKIFYFLSLGYVLLGYFFLDWSSRMVPSVDTQLNLLHLIYIGYIVAGAMLFLGTLLALKKYSISNILFNLVLWGWAGILGVSCFIVATMIALEKISEVYFGDIIMHLIIFLPVMFVYCSRKRIME